MLDDLKWSSAEKTTARNAYEIALRNELAEIISEFKARAAAVTTPDEMWALEDYLAAKRRDVEEKYDYRYSRLIFMFAQLLREGRSCEEDLRGLSEEKLAHIRTLLSL